MNMQGTRNGDIVLVDKKGRRFHAELRDRDRETGDWGIMPLSCRITWRTARAHEVKKLWRLSRSSL